MNIIEEVECKCGTIVEISEYSLSLRGETVLTTATCPICDRTLYQTEIDGLVLVEVVLRGDGRKDALPGAPPK